MVDYKTYKEYLEDSPGNPYNITIDDVSNTPIGLRRCQYWVNGLPGICKHWDSEGEGRCTYQDNYPNLTKPSLFNNGKCDYLGRRSACSEYDNGGNQDYSEYVCIAPDPFRTGLLKMVVESIPPYKETGDYVAVPKSSILGYNGDSSGVGRCDGRGTGCGEAGASGESTDNIVVCNYFKPWHMGFGLIKPEDIKTLAVYINSPDTYFSELYNNGIEFDLPFNLKIFNARAKMQKCIYWDKDEGSEFINDDWEIYLEDESSIDDISSLCTCKDTEAKKYATQRTDNYPFGLQNIWSQQNCIICNGAKPECPKYTGQWVYCVDEKMKDGALVSAQQMMELRFWLRDWESQEVYDEYYSRFRPNTSQNDPGSSAIFTFEKWNTYNIEEPHKSLIEGDKVTMCMPAPYLDKVFIPKDYIDIVPIIYNAEQGTTDEETPSFPTLIRDIETDIPKPLKVIYPYPYKELWTEPCEQPTEDFYIKKSTAVEGDGIYVFGTTIRNKTVYAFNYTIINELGLSRSCPNELLELTSSFFIDIDDRQDFYDRLTDYVEFLVINAPEHLYKSNTSTDYGTFMVGPVELKYQEYNNLVICVDVDGVWEFTKRKVWSQWYGGMVIQNNYSMEFDSGSENSGYLEEATYKVLPSTDGGGILQPLYGKNDIGLAAYPDGVKHVYSHKNIKVGGISGISYKTTYSYLLVENTLSDILEENWAQIGLSPMLWVETDRQEINYVFSYTIDRAYLAYECSSENADDCDSSLAGTEIELELLYPQNDSQKLYFHPNAFVLKLKDDSNLYKFDDNWQLYITYKYQSIEYEEISSQDASSKEILFPNLTEMATGDDVVFVSDIGLEIDTPYYGYGYTMDSPSDSFNKRIFNVNSIRNRTVSLMSYFVDEDYRLISMVATKFVIPVSRIFCRAVEIEYSFKALARVQQLTYNTRFATLDTVNTVPKFTGEITTHYSPPVCGDHKLDSNNYGYMWFPFTCDQSWGLGSNESYDERTPANFCNSAIEGTFFLTETEMREGKKTRLMGPYKNQTFVGPALNWLEACAPMWDYYFSSTDGYTIIWDGHGNIVNSRKFYTYYSLRGEDLPPFGPTNRERISRWFSEDYVDYLSYKSPSVDLQYHDDRFWFPMVFDNKCLSYTFNTLYTTNTLLNQVHDVSYIPDDSLDFFDYNNQFVHYVSDDLSEVITEERYSFEQVFGEEAPSGYSWCSYPLPVYSCFKPDIEVLASGVINTEATINDCIYMYHFNIPYTNWVWRENWQPIERDKEDGRICFIDIIKPSYMFDYYKKEHRFIPEEGYYTITFTKPEIPRKIQDGGVLTRPSISLGNYPRWFDIIYDDYNEERVNWYDIDSGKTPYPGQETSGDNIYQNTMGDQWLHDKNLIYDDSASESILNAHQFISNVEVELEDVDVELYFYNTGIITDIFKDRLKYMPYEISDEQIFDMEDVSTDPESITTSDSVSYVPKNLEGKKYVWDTNSTPNITMTFKNKKECLYYLPDAIKGPTCLYSGDPPDKVDGKGDCTVQGDYSDCSCGEDYPMPHCIVKIIIRGYWGVFEDLVIDENGKYNGETNKVYVCKPGLTLKEVKTTVNPQDATHDNQVWSSDTGITTIYSSTVEVPPKTQQFVPYETEIVIAPDPKRMTLDRSNKIIIELTGNGVENNYICISDVEGYSAEYVNKSEIFKVWERKYRISKGDSSAMGYKTVNGYDTAIAADMDLDNSTLVFAYANSSNGSYFSAADKCRSMYAGPIASLDEEIIQLNKTNLVEKEISVQKELYENAYKGDQFESNTFNYKAIVPPTLEYFFESIGILDDLNSYLSELDINFRSDKLVWDKTWARVEYNGDGEIEAGWQPSGHIYQWGDTAVRTSCMLTGPIENAVDAEYVHVDHNNGSTETPIATYAAGPQVSAVFNDDPGVGAFVHPVDASFFPEEA